MNFFSKNRFLFWLLIFLVGVNISAMVTIIVLVSKKAPPSNQQPVKNTGNAFTKTLSLSPGQTGKVETILNDYKNLTEPISADIRNRRIQILEELAKKNPDKAILTSNVKEISMLQTQMQNASIDQYMALKEICTPDQCQRLSALYYELYGCQGQGPGMGKGKGPGQGKGMMRRYRGGRGN
ncbi:MAG: periplasmic heavy metal sensor [Bacteroidota bacterium]